MSLRTRLAALIDGEGCIGIARSGKTIHARIDIGNTDKVLIETVQNITGTGSITERPPKKNGHAMSWHWRIQCDAVEGLLEQIAPHLRTKGPQAALALSVQHSLKLPANRVNREWHSQAIVEMNDLNGKGPRRSHALSTEKEP